MKFQTGNIATYALLIIALSMLALSMYDPVITPEELKQVQVLASADPDIKKELQEFLLRTPTPTRKQFKDMKKLAQMGNLEKASADYAGKPYETLDGYKKKYFKEKKERQTLAQREKEQLVRINITPFSDLSDEDRIVYFLKYSPLNTIIGIFIIIGFLGAVFQSIFKQSR